TGVSFVASLNVTKVTWKDTGDLSVEMFVSNYFFAIYYQSEKFNRSSGKIRFHAPDALTTLLISAKNRKSPLQIESVFTVVSGTYQIVGVTGMDEDLVEGFKQDINHDTKKLEKVRAIIKETFRNFFETKLRKDDQGLFLAKCIGV